MALEPIQNSIAVFSRGRGHGSTRSPSARCRAALSRRLRASPSPSAQWVRLAEQPALAVVDADPPERLELFDRVEALADDPRTDPVGERLQRAQQVLPARILVDLRAERAIDL